MPAAPPLAVIILAAGRGTRMNSDLHKVLHPLAGRPMLLHLLATVAKLDPARVVVVAGDKADQVAAAVAPYGATVVIQDRQLGTGHAVRQAESALGGFEGDVLVLYGDVPLVEAATLHAMLAALGGPRLPGCVVLAFRPADPAGYGRVIVEADGTVLAMVEDKDATPHQRAVTLCNSGLLAARAGNLFGWLAKVGNDNAAGEFYLPDVVMLAAAEWHRGIAVEASAAEVAGVNSRGDLAAVEAAWQQRRRAAAMAAGVTLIAPETVWFAFDTVLGRDVTIEPNVVFGPGVSVADGATIRAFSHVAGAHLGAGAEAGPFARLRPGSALGSGAKVGNFVEIKAARLGDGAKVNHLSYIGDADIGAAANIGAGTITCNYDGFLKHRTEVGDGAFIGSNSALVAPVRIGAGAIVGAGSTVTADVEPGALALTRAPQLAKAGWATRFRAAMTARKAAKG